MMDSLRLASRELGTRVAVRLSEWSSLSPERVGPGRRLLGLSFGEDGRLRAHASELQRTGVVSITERIDGLVIETGSFVGQIAIGPVEITIVPKISSARWLTLVGYALSLRHVVRSAPLELELASVPLQDLIVMELVSEARDLVARGLHREYERQRAPLATPRGRVDFQRIAQRGGIREPTVPSRFTRRSDNSPLNRALLAGLRLAERRAADHGLRSAARALVHEMALSVVSSPLSPELLSTAGAIIDRRTRRYQAALRLIQLLQNGDAVTLDDQPDLPRVQLPGFAVDMNRIWQQVVARVIREWADEVDVREEFALRNVFQRNPSYPLRRRVPQPRPDFAAFVNGRLLGYLDAKYRDLWERGLPRDMLYQLSLYAMAQGNGAAAILYPTGASAAVEQRIDIHDPTTGTVRGSVALRPVPLATLEELISAANAPVRNERRRAFARSLLGLP